MYVRNNASVLVSGYLVICWNSSIATIQGIAESFRNRKISSNDASDLRISPIPIESEGVPRSSNVTSGRNDLSDIKKASKTFRLDDFNWSKIFLLNRKTKSFNDLVA